MAPVITAEDKPGGQPFIEFPKLESIIVFESGGYWSKGRRHTADTQVPGS